jgi:hypothetical protein
MHRNIKESCSACSFSEEVISKLAHFDDSFEITLEMRGVLCVLWIRMPLKSASSS